jgi:replicative DNA helicase
MFIHREDKTRSASERPDGPLEAEILIEKHRNGPTGYVKLHFDGSKTTFLSVDKQYNDFAPPPTTMEEF